LSPAREGWLSRELLEDHATSYGALSRTKEQRATLAAILNDDVRTHFPEYAKAHSGASFSLGMTAIFLLTGQTQQACLVQRKAS